MLSIEDQIVKYLERKGWKYTLEDKQFRVKVCPFCKDSKWHFDINRLSGQYSCWKCPESGSLYSLKRKLGDVGAVTTFYEEDETRDQEPKLHKGKVKKWTLRIKEYNKNLIKNKGVRKFIFKKWGYDKRAIVRFNLGFRKRKGVKYLVIPYYENGKLVNAKFRSLPPAEKYFHRIKDMKSSLFNIDNINRELDYIIVCEGESDAINLSMLGFENVVGVTVGAKGFKASWYDFITKFESVYIFYDQDEAGQTGASKFAHRIGLNRCRNVKLPIKGDVTDYILQGNGKEEIESLLSSAEQFDVEGVVNLKNALRAFEDSVRRREQGLSSSLDYGFKTPWQNVNEILGGMVPGDLIVVSGRPKVGKSTWALNILLNLSSGLISKQKIPSLYYCLEMRPERIAPKIVSYTRLVDPKFITTSDIIVTEMRSSRYPFYLASSPTFKDDEVIYDTIRESTQRYGIKIVLFDNLHFFVRSKDQTADVSVAVQKFKLLAEELSVPILLIAQGRKMSGKSNIMTMEDLRDSSSIGTDGDTIIILHRARRDQKSEMTGINNGMAGMRGSMPAGTLYSSTTKVIIEGTRFNESGQTEIHYSGAMSRFFTNKAEMNRMLKSRVNL